MHFNTLATNKIMRALLSESYCICVYDCNNESEITCTSAANKDDSNATDEFLIQHLMECVMDQKQKERSG